MKNPANDQRLLQLDAFLPPEMARRAEQIGMSKAKMPAATTFALAILAGAFIGMGAMFATVVTTGAAESLTFGVAKLLGGLAFSLGLVLVIVAGVELFTGNNLMIMAVASDRPGHFVQCARLSCRLALFQRPFDNRQDPGDHLSYYGLCGCRFRA